MLNINTDNTEPTHVERIEPNITVDNLGEISWNPLYNDHDASAFYRGKTVTNQEFNNLFLKGVYQGNYLTDTMKLLLGEKLITSIRNVFTSNYNLHSSYIKEFTSDNWGTPDSEGYYYIDIPASEHGFAPISEDDSTAQVDTMNIDVELYLLDTTNNKFYEVLQSEVLENNLVRIYTDDPTVIGFVTIRNNDRAYSFSSAIIDATQIKGFDDAVKSAVSYNSLVTQINNNASAIDLLKVDLVKTDNPFVVNKAINADVAESANSLPSTGKINGINVNSVFETNSNVVKQATNANHASTADNATNATNANHATNADNAVNAVSATSATNASSANTANVATNAVNAVPVYSGNNVTSYKQIKASGSALMYESTSIMRKKYLYYDSSGTTSYKVTGSLIGRIFEVGIKSTTDSHLYFVNVCQWKSTNYAGYYPVILSATNTSLLWVNVYLDTDGTISFLTPKGHTWSTNATSDSDFDCKIYSVAEIFSE